MASNKNELDEIKESIEFNIWRKEKHHEYYRESDHDRPIKVTVHEWPEFVYAHSRYGSKEPLHIKTTIDYDLTSKMFGLTYRKEIDEYEEGHPIEEIHKLDNYQDLSIEDAITMGNELNHQLELELLELPKNNLGKAEATLDNNPKTCDQEIEF